MIIRRRHTANFTTIGNALFDDERLEADEVGVLSYLLSRPDNWEVRRPALARRWRIGRDSIKRILLNLIRFGWIVARKTRLSNGTFHVVYEVRDEPGPELTEAEAKSATSLVSSDAGSGEDSGEERTAQSEPADVPKEGADPPTENPSWSVENQHPTTGLPATAGQHPQTRHGPSKEELTNLDSTKIDSLESESARAREPLISAEAVKVADQIAAIAGLPDPKNWPPGWCGAAMRIDAFLREGYHPEILLIAAREVMAGRKGQEPPWSIEYFAKAFAKARTRQLAPLPDISKTNSSETSRREPRPGSREDRQERTTNARRKLREFAYGAEPDGQDRSSEAGGSISGELRLPKPT